jgi:hypothetical protein
LFGVDEARAKAFSISRSFSLLQISPASFVDEDASAIEVANVEFDDTGVAPLEAGEVVFGAAGGRGGAAPIRSGELIEGGAPPEDEDGVATDAAAKDATDAEDGDDGIPPTFAPWIPDKTAAACCCCCCCKRAKCSASIHECGVFLQLIMRIIKPYSICICLRLGSTLFYREFFVEIFLCLNTREQKKTIKIYFNLKKAKFTENSLFISLLF